LNNETANRDERSLSRSTLILYGLPEYAMFLASIPVSLYLPFVYTKDLGLELTDVGLLLMLARITDVVTDPLIGYLSDKTSGRFGRRKPWLAVGALLMMVSAYQLFNPQGAVDNSYLLTWAVTLWLGWTMINIPYYAWGAEISDSYHERTRITGWRQAFAFLGNLSVLAVPVISGQLFGYGGIPSEGLAIVGSMALVALPVLVSITLWRVPERTDVVPVRSSLLKNTSAMLRNGSFMLLFMGFMFMSLGTAWGSATFLLFATYVVEAEGQTQAILLGYFGANILALPLWVALSRKIGKKTTWTIGAILFVLVTPLFLAVGAGDLWLFFLILALYGIAGGNFAAISMSMKADVIEIASRRSGENIAGSYIAIWSLGQKMVGALSIGLALPFLQYMGFDPNGDNGPEQIKALSLVYVLPPWLFYAIAIAFIWRYPLSGERLIRLRAAFDRRDSRRAATP
jgi:GPH family glycoside/pentoside/hexuronide:cation symporter